MIFIKNTRSNIVNKPPTFINNIHKGIKITDYLFSPSSINRINSTIDSVQKLLLFYDKTKPIIIQTYPLLANIKTTLKVAKAFKSIDKNYGIEQMIDNLPDYKIENNESKQGVEKDNKVAKPFYP